MPPPAPVQILDVIHPGRATIPHKECQELLAAKFNSKANLVSLFGFRTQFGGGKSTGFGLIYDNMEKLKHNEPLYRIRRAGYASSPLVLFAVRGVRAGGRRQIRSQAPRCRARGCVRPARWLWRARGLLGEGRRPVCALARMPGRLPVL